MHAALKAAESSTAIGYNKPDLIGALRQKKATSTEYNQRKRHIDINDKESIHKLLADRLDIFTVINIVDKKRVCCLIDGTRFDPYTNTKVIKSIGDYATRSRVANTSVGPMFSVTLCVDGKTYSAKRATESNALVEAMIMAVTHHLKK